MRVLINGVSMLGRLTGIGWYTRNLTLGLAADPRIERVGVFDGSKVVAADQFLGRIENEDRIVRHERLKSLSTRIPFRRHLVAAVRGTCFRRAVRPADWTLFHEPNYVAHAFAGPLVTTVCDCCWLRFPKFQPKDRLAWLEERLVATLKRSRAIITISEFSKREIQEAWPWINPEHVFVTPMGVDAGNIDDSPVDGKSEDLIELKQRLGLPERFTLFVGTLEPRKNLQGLLEAYRCLPESLRREFPLVLAGANGWNRWYFRGLLEELRSQGCLHVLGYLPRRELPMVMRLASAFCFPSVYEGFGMPPLEAAACGTPVVCGDIPALREVMGNAAIYVDPNCPEDIAAGLTHVLTNETLARRLAEQGRQRALSFTWQRSVRETLSAYDFALHGNKPADLPLRKAS